jgi:tetratricopeptide (TPR) repeat protein/tRNA A-37 threonylcarbamoyl transferase component Bud32
MNPIPGHDDDSSGVMPTLMSGEDLAGGVNDAKAGNSSVQTCAVPANRIATSGRYVVTAFHARGGMGEVWRCKDANIGREVALKRLSSTRSAARDRFLCEAQITGQLEHPAVVPVHDLGFDENGDPFYVMKFVHGRTLKCVIEDFHDPQSDRSEPRQTVRTRLLKIFLDLCNAVAYAHSRGVIHRDLKPENVMLGPYGETILLDWGLAKIAGQPEGTIGSISSLSASRPALSGQSSQTEDGSILGSPLYMAPEMAEGHHSDADQRTDVYLLGATLYEMLCGQPPRRGASRDELLELARTAAPVPPCKLVADTPRALQAICLKAMARSKSHRYESAMALAKDVENYLAAERVSAYREPAIRRTWRWAKKHRRTLARSAAAVALVLIVAMLYAFRREAQRLHALELARADVRAIEQLTDEARFFAASVDAPSEDAPYYDPARGENKLLPALDASAKWGPTLAGLPLAEERDRLRGQLAQTALQVAQLKLQLSSDAPSVAAAGALLDRAAQLGLDSRGFHRVRAMYYRLAGRAADSVHEEQVASVARDSAHDLFLDGEHLRLSSDLDLVRFAQDSKANAQRRSNTQKAVEAYQAALAQDPRDYWTHLQLGRCLLAIGRGPEAVQALSACIALRPDAPWGYSSRGLALALLGRKDDASADLDRADKLDPNCLPALLNRAVLNIIQQQSNAAAAQLDALLLRPDRPAEALFYRGRLQLDAGDAAAAASSFSALLRERPQFVPAYIFRATAYLMLARENEALADLDQVSHSESRDASLAKRGHLLRLIAAQVPKPQQQSTLALAQRDLKLAAESPHADAGMLADLGAVLYNQGQIATAIQAYSAALERSPRELQVLINRGWAYEEANQLEAAAKDFESAILAAPANPEAHTGLGYIRARQQRDIDAQRSASLAILYAADDYRIFHNAACIYAELSRSVGVMKTEHENVALNLLRAALDRSRAERLGKTELLAIQTERAFIGTINHREEFRELLSQ